MSRGVLLRADRVTVPASDAGRGAVRPALAALAISFAVGGAVLALLLLLALAVVYLMRDPGRLLDAAYVAAFCALGYLAG